MNIKCNQWYKRRDGRKAFIAFNKGYGDIPFVGIAMDRDGEFTTFHYAISGGYSTKGESDFDLICECEPDAVQANRL